MSKNEEKALNKSRDKENLEKIDQRIKELNTILDRVAIRRKGDRLFLRATLPDRETGKNKQQDLKTGAPATTTGLQAAKIKAARLSEQLILDTFSWDKWSSRKIGNTCKDWIDKLTDDHWHRIERTKSRERSFREDYLIPYSKLPPNAILTADLLKKTLLSETEPGKGKTRNRYCLAYTRLANFANLGIDFNRYRVNYEPKERYLPSDEEIEATIDAIKNPAWQWIAGIMAAYGLRPHELFHLDTSRMDGPEPLLKVLPNTKTKDRSILPCPPEWVDRWNLKEKRWPEFKVTPHTHDNKDLGARITPSLKRNGVNWTAYAFRDCYVIRLEKAGWPENLSEIMGGHSRETRKKSYLRHVRDRDLIEMFKKLNQTD
jgi:integrase